MIHEGGPALRSDDLSSYLSQREHARSTMVDLNLSRFSVATVLLVVLLRLPVNAGCVTSYTANARLSQSLAVTCGMPYSVRRIWAERWREPPGPLLESEQAEANGTSVTRSEIAKRAEAFMARPR